MLCKCVCTNSCQKQHSTYRWTGNELQLIHVNVWVSRWLLYTVYHASFSHERAWVRGLELQTCCTKFFNQLKMKMKSMPNFILHTLTEEFWVVVEKSIAKTWRTRACAIYIPVPRPFATSTCRTWQRMRHASVILKKVTKDITDTQQWIILF